MGGFDIFPVPQPSPYIFKKVGDLFDFSHLEIAMVCRRFVRGGGGGGELAPGGGGGLSTKPALRQQGLLLSLTFYQINNGGFNR